MRRRQRQNECYKDRCRSSRNAYPVPPSTEGHERGLAGVSMIRRGARTNRRFRQAGCSVVSAVPSVAGRHWQRRRAPPLPDRRASDSPHRDHAPIARPRRKGRGTLIVPLIGLPIARSTGLHRLRRGIALAPGPTSAGASVPGSRSLPRTRSRPRPPPRPTQAKSPIRSGRCRSRPERVAGPRPREGCDGREAAAGRPRRPRMHHLQTCMKIPTSRARTAAGPITRSSIGIGIVRTGFSRTRPESSARPAVRARPP